MRPFSERLSQCRPSCRAFVSSQADVWMGTLRAVYGLVLTMKRYISLSHPALAAIAVALAFPSTPLFAQEAPQAESAQPAAQPTPAAPEATAAPIAPPAPVFAPKQEVLQPTPPRPVISESPAPAAAEPTTSSAQSNGQKRAQQAKVISPARSSKTAVRVPTPAYVEPVTSARAIAANVPDAVTPPLATVIPPVGTSAPVVTPSVDEATPVQAAEPAVAGDDASQNDTTLLWSGAGIGVFGILVGLMMRRRRRARSEWVDEAPVVPSANVRGGDALTLDQRPWIRLSVQPSGYSLNDGVSTVEYELIVENEGKLAANDVRVSSFLIGARSSSLSDAIANGQAQTHHINVASGQSVTLYGKVMVPDGSDPKIVADARYLLPDGSDGHLAARFVIDMSAPQPAAMVEDVLDRV